MSDQADTMLLAVHLTHLQLVLHWFNKYSRQTVNHGVKITITYTL